MLLVHPIRELIRFLPVLLGLLVAGSRSGGNEWWWNVLGIGVPIALGVARYLTTSFRIFEGRVELRRGLLNKHVLSTPIDRVRTVDISASLIHRVLGLTTVRIGTGTSSKLGDDELALDGVRVHAADALRSDLLHRSVSPEVRETAQAPDNARLVTRFEPRWLWYAPFTTAGMVIAAAVVGAGSQVLDALGLWDHLQLDEAAEQAARLVPAAGRAPAGGRGDRGGVGDGGARLPGHELRLHGDLHALRPRLAPASRAVHDAGDEHGRQPAARGQPRRAARPAPRRRCAALGDRDGPQPRGAGVLDPGAAGPAPGVPARRHRDARHRRAPDDTAPRPRARRDPPSVHARAHRPRPALGGAGRRCRC